MTVTIKDFVKQFPVADDNIRAFLLAHAGLKPEFLFKQPDKPTKNQVVQFLQLLQDLEKEPTQQKIEDLNKLIGILDLGVARPQEEQDDVVIFYPKRNQGKPFKVGAVYGLRLGKIKENGDPETGTVNNFFHIEEHVGQDGTTDMGIAEFFEAKGKFFLLNASAPHVAKNPQKGKIDYFSDPAHSNTTIFVTFLTELLQKHYPEMPGTITHGMDGAANFQFLINNNFNGKFFRNGRRSFANLIAIALAQQNFGDESPKVAVASEIPGFIMKHGTKLRMSPLNMKNPQAALRLPGKAITTNVDGHIANFSQAPLSNKGRQTDRVIHLECGDRPRAVANNPNRPNAMRNNFIEALKVAIEWYAKYDPAIHDPWKLDERFTAVFNDMSKYGTLFDAEFMAKYKQSARYKEDAATYEQFYKEAEENDPLARFAAADDEDPNPDLSDDEEDFDLVFAPTKEDDTPPTIEELEDDLPKPLMFRPRRSVGRRDDGKGDDRPGNRGARDDREENRGGREERRAAMHGTRRSNSPPPA